MGVATVYQVMPTLDPQVAAMLPAPYVAKALGCYALVGALCRVMQLRSPPPPHA